MHTDWNDKNTKSSTVRIHMKPTVNKCTTVQIASDVKHFSFITNISGITHFNERFPFPFHFEQIALHMAFKETHNRKETGGSGNSLNTISTFIVD